MGGGHLHPTYLLDHFHHVAHLGSLIWWRGSARHCNLQQSNHLLLDILVPHQLQIKHLRCPFLSHHRLHPPWKIHHSSVPRPRPTVLHHGRALSCEQLQQKHPKRIHIRLLGALSAVQYFRGTVAIWSGCSRWRGKDGETKVGNSCATTFIKEDVCGLDVTVGEFKRLAWVVNKGQSSRRSGCNLQPRGPVQRRSSGSTVPCRGKCIITLN